LADILASVRGLFVTSDRNNYQYVGVRGLDRPGGYNSRILLLVDGIRVNDANYDTASIGNEFFLDVDLIDRVEVVRGPGSSIYGSNAFFGVVIDPRTQTVDSLAVLDLAYGGKLSDRLDLSSRVYYGGYFYDATFPYDAPSVTVNKDQARAEWWGGEAKLTRHFARHKVVFGEEYQDNFRQDLKNHDVAPYALDARPRASYVWQITRAQDTGAELENSPRHLAKLNYTMPLFGDALRAGMELQYTSSRKTLAGAKAGGYGIANLTLPSDKLAQGPEVSTASTTCLTGHSASCGPRCSRCPARRRRRPAPLGKYEVEAAFVHDFAKFVEWPAAIKSRDTLRLCVLGRGQFADAAASLRGKPLGSAVWEVVLSAKAAI